MRRLFHYSLLILLVNIGWCGPSATQSPTVTLSVTGTGPSIDDAKTDAVRRALQLTVKQLVVVDRAIGGNTILRDKVLSTMNGYVDKFEQKEIKKTNVGYALTAEITISASRIQNFIGITTGAGATIEGSELFREQDRRIAQINAENLQAQARSEIFDRLFRGFPSDALDVKIVSTRLNATHHEFVDVEIETSYKRTFLQSLEKTITALGGVVCERVPIYFNFHIPVEMVMDSTAGNACSSQLRTANILCLGYPGSEQKHGVRCYGLPPGHYCKTCRLEGLFQYMIILSRFVDSVGQPSGSRCIESVGIRGPAEFTQGTNEYRFNSRTIEVYFKHMQWQGRPATIMGLDVMPRRFTLHIHTSQIDLKRSKQLIAIGAFGSSGFQGIWRDKTPAGWVTNLVPDGSPRAACDLLEEAVQRYLVTR